MASKISALPTGSAIASTDIIGVGVQTAAPTVTASFTASIVAAFLATATLAAGAITTSQPMTLTQTWNAAGVTFTGFKVNVTNTASATGSLLADFQASTVSKIALDKSGTIRLGGGVPGAQGLGNFGIVSSGNLYLSANSTDVALIQSNSLSLQGVLGLTASLGSSPDVILVRDAANTLALRNVTAPQIFNLYATYTDASNYARLALSYDGSEYKIGGQHAGTGTPQSLYLLSDKDILFGVIGSGVSWKIDTSSNFVCGSDGGGNIGASGANRPTQLFLAPSTTAHANINLPATGVAPTSPNNGDLWFDGTGLKMQIGGVTKTATFT